MFTSSDVTQFDPLSPPSLQNEEKKGFTTAKCIMLRPLTGICYHAAFSKPLPNIPIGGNLLSQSRDDCPIYLNSSSRNLGYFMTPLRTSYLDGPWAESNRHREIQGKERCKQATSLARQNRRFSKFRLRTTTTTTTEEDRRPKRDRFSAHCKLPLPPLLSSLAVSTPDHSA